MAVWLLARCALSRAGPVLDPSHPSVIGATSPPQSNLPGLWSTPLNELRRLERPEVARLALVAIPATAAILLHFDTDAILCRDMPQAHFQHGEGLIREVVVDLLSVGQADPRLRLVEVPEYASRRDADLSASA